MPCPQLRVSALPLSFLQLLDLCLHQAILIAIPLDILAMVQPSTALLRPRISKSCDQCKARKVRCICTCYVDEWSLLMLCISADLLLDLAGEPNSQSCRNCVVRALCFFCFQSAGHCYSRVLSLTTTSCCQRRNTQCHFSQTRRKLRYLEPGVIPGHGTYTYAVCHTLSSCAHQLRKMPLPCLAFLQRHLQISGLGVPVHRIAGIGNSTWIVF